MKNNDETVITLSTLIGHYERALEKELTPKQLSWVTMLKSMYEQKGQIWGINHAKKLVAAGLKIDKDTCIGEASDEE